MKWGSNDVHPPCSYEEYQEFLVEAAKKMSLIYGKEYTPEELEHQMALLLQRPVDMSKEELVDFVENRKAALKVGFMSPEEL